MCEVGYVKADSGNLPEVDIFMVMDYFNKNKDYVSTEMKGIKLERSGRQNYGDNAIGYVQVRQQQSLFELKAKITPEHRIKSKNYSVSCIVNSAEKTVLDAKCHDCSASEGGCKHAVAFLMWLHRRSEEASPTEKICYWKRSVLSTASSTNECITTADFGKKKFNINYDDSLLRGYIQEAKKRKINNSLMRYYNPQKYSCLSIYHLGVHFKNSNLIKTPENFVELCKLQMEKKLISEVQNETKNQSESKLWQEMRYGRITASKAYEVVKCKTLDGCLVKSILGAKIYQTYAMSRGLKLEKDVLKVLSTNTSMAFSKAGIFLLSDFPLLGASPDAINKDFVVEIKSPSSEKTLLNYLDSSGNINPKYLYQIQMQMHFAKRDKAIFVVADPAFETSRKITVKYCEYDDVLVEEILDGINNFWFKAIFNKVV